MLMRKPKKLVVMRRRKSRKKKLKLVVMRRRKSRKKKLMMLKRGGVKMELQWVVPSTFNLARTSAPAFAWQRPGRNARRTRLSLPMAPRHSSLLPWRILLASTLTLTTKLLASILMLFLDLQAMLSTGLM